jgi:hypothetical protein
MPVPICEPRVCAATLVLGQKAHLNLLRIYAADKLVCICIVGSIIRMHGVRSTGGDLYAVKRG